MNNPGEFFAPIAAGPFRGVPAIHLLDVEGKTPESELGRLLEDAASYFGLLYPNKPFLYLSRSVDPRIVRLVREWGCYIVGDPIRYAPWVEECNHVMITFSGKWNWNNRCDSVIFAPDIETTFQEPTLDPQRYGKLPKYLYINGFNKPTMGFILNSQYPWSVQQYQKPPFKVGLSLIYKEKESELH